ncbi:RagB/SusD family nutrient uptake outer membrane protein [Spirosoma spitsbergense]|uniref:RagB/SusD family nutrient uptake outer membrane protein n=1 Tax=Spirosoma spitsbergense TaxID=431554 RepID=UPI0003823A12|nr:RagB/SusD family nutrient uptake outer membrane protein [Spirosoma spitsbergense]
MKKYILFPLLLAATACSDLLQEVPVDRLSQENFYRTKSDLMAGLNAVYAQVRGANSYGTNYPAQLNGMADYCISRGTQIPVSEFKGLDGTNVGRTNNIWRDLFQAINSANIIIKLTPGVTLSDADRNAVLGEARFLRAFNYYNLVRNYGGVPLRTEPVTTTGQVGGKRATIDEVYKLIADDLQFAETALPGTQAEIGRPTSWAAKLLLASMYLTRENWTAARDKADEVIKSGLYSLVEVKTSDEFEKVFGADLTTSPEEVFYLKYARIAGQGWGYPSYQHPADGPYTTGVRAHWTTTAIPLIKNWSDKDLRKDYNLYSSYINRSGKLTTFPTAEPICFRKFRDVPANPAGNDFPFLRYAEALLISAEAGSQAANGPTAAALENLNRVHRRAYGFPPNVPAPSVDFTLAGQTAASFRDLVLTERAYEFMMEAGRWLDLKRLGVDKLKTTIKAARGKDVADAHLLWPIPQQEIDNNPDISVTDQNPGY